MPINETQLNGRIATLLDRMNARWSALGETHGAFEGSQRQPDILIHQQGGRPVIIENEYQPARSLEAEAVARLGENLDPSIVGTSGSINAVVALRSPIELQNCRSHDEVDASLSGDIRLEYALFSGASVSEFTRFPQQGFIPGDLKDLAAFVSYATVPEDAIQTAIDTLVSGIGASAAILREACEVSDSTKLAITDVLKQDYSDQTLRMAATIMINALVFHLNLSGKHGVPDFNQAMPGGLLISGRVMQLWYEILKVNYWSIFKVAVDLLYGIASIPHANRALAVMHSTAEKICASGVGDSQDLVGTVFQRLIADRKYLATFYTRPESAALLAHLAIPEDDGWDNAERVKNYNVADYACGTGTLIHAAYRRINQLHLLSGGQPDKLHAHMMKNALTACDVLPSAVHLTASMLSSSHPAERYEGTRTIVAQYGKTDNGGVSIGSLDLLASNGEVRPLIALHSGTTVTSTGEESAEVAVDMPQFSQDLVIMNPPFTRSGSDWEGDARDTDYIKPFRGLGNDLDTQRRMSALKRKYGKDTNAHGYAGIASWFVALADRMVKSGGTVALVLPMTVLQGTSWKKTRQLVSEKYSDVTVVTIAAPNPADQAFSADTEMAETLLLCRRSDEEVSGRGLFVSLNKRPRSEMEAMELAKAIRGIDRDRQIRTMESGPYGGHVISIGGEQIGEAIEAPLSAQAPWSNAGVADFAVVQTAYQMSQGTLWLPQMDTTYSLSIAMVDQIAKVGFHDMNIAGSGTQAGFERIDLSTNFPTYPMLWNHYTELERCLIVAPDSEGRVRLGKESRANEIWETRSYAHQNRDFGFASQCLGVAITENRTLGGRAWPNVQFNRREHETAYSLWGNSTLGLISYWFHASRQQSGRGLMPITAIRSMPTLDVTRLSEDQLQVAKGIFDEIKHLEFLPANEAYRDDTRKLLDRRVLIDLLNLPDSILEPLDTLRLKWCSEPSVHGGKATAPPGAYTPP